jgi:hypothetical protein
VVILGRGGAGKSTLAGRLGEVTGLPVVELDTLFWQAGPTAADPSEWTERQRELVRGEAWILDGDLGPSRRGSREIDHLGSAHDDAEVELLKAAARQRLAAGQDELDLGLQPDAGAGGGPLPITSSRMGHLWDALACSYAVLGLEQAARGDEVFRDLVLARIIEPISKLDSARVLEETGIAPVSYPTVNRRLRMYARDSWRARLSAACAAHAGLGPASLVLYDVSTLYFETDADDGFPEPGFSKERRLEPQITIGLLAGQDGFLLMVNAFEGNKAETTTMLPVIEAFMEAHRIPDVTVVADAGMVRSSATNGGRCRGGVMNADATPS